MQLKETSPSAVHYGDIFPTLKKKLIRAHSFFSYQFLSFFFCYSNLFQKNVGQVLLISIFPFSVNLLWSGSTSFFFYWICLSSSLATSVLLNPEPSQFSSYLTSLQHSAVSSPGNNFFIWLPRHHCPMVGFLPNLLLLPAFLCLLFPFSLMS